MSLSVKVLPDATPVFVSSQTCEQVLAFPDAIAALKRAYSTPLGPAVSPPRVVTRGERTWLRALAASPPNSRYMGAKVFGLGRAYTVSYLIALFEQESGALAALVDGNLVTAYRTAATSAVAFDRLAPKDVPVVSVLGSGLEAQMHLRAFATLRKFAKVRVFSPTQKNREAFAKNLGSELGLDIEPASSAEAAVRGSDAVIGATRCIDGNPVLFGDWLHEGMTVVSIGSTLPEHREIDDAAVAKTDFIVCDVPEEVAKETGEMISARKAGIAFEHKTVSLNALMTGTVDSQAKASRLPMFKSVGAAVQDIVVAELVVEKAAAAGLTEATNLHFLMKK